MPQFRIILKAKGTVYSYYTGEADDIEIIRTKMKDQALIDRMASSDTADLEDFEVDEDADPIWSVDDIVLIEE